MHVTPAAALHHSETAACQPRVDTEHAHTDAPLRRHEQTFEA